MRLSFKYCFFILPLSQHINTSMNVHVTVTELDF